MEEPDLQSHFDMVVKAILRRSVIPFLGAGASLCDRGERNWNPSGSDCLPDSDELAEFLAEYYNYPDNEPKVLTRVSQYAAVDAGLGSLYDTLQRVFDRPYRPTILHQFLAELPAILRNKGVSYENAREWRRRLLIITTNYDDLLEQAFKDAGERYHKLVYMADETPGDKEVHLVHWTPDGEVFLIEELDRYGRLEEYDRSTKDIKYPVIIKIHGTVDRTTPQDNQSYVITEDHYIDYLARFTKISSLLPQSIVTTLKKSHFLFLGYSLQDWNLRVLWRGIWEDQKLNFNSWAVQRKVKPIDRTYWESRNVKIIEMEVGDYIRTLKEYL